MRTATFSGPSLPLGGISSPLVVDRLDDQALFGLAGDDRRSRLAPFEDRLQRVEPQAPFLLLVAVARVALLSEQRPDVLLEEVLAGGLGGGVRLAAIRGGQGRSDRYHHSYAAGKTANPRYRLGRSPDAHLDKPRAGRPDAMPSTSSVKIADQIAGAECSTRMYHKADRARIQRRDGLTECALDFGRRRRYELKLMACWCKLDP